MTSPRRFHAALAHIAEAFPPEVAARALGAWHLICAKADPPEPTIGGEDDVRVTFAWSTEAHYLDLHVRADGFEWFYTDRKARASGGTEDELEATIPDAFFARLAEFSAPPRETEAELRALCAHAAVGLENGHRFLLMFANLYYAPDDQAAALDLIARLRKAGAP